MGLALPLIHLVLLGRCEAAALLQAGRAPSPAKNLSVPFFGSCLVPSLPSHFSGIRITKAPVPIFAFAFNAVLNLPHLL